MDTPPPNDTSPLSPDGDNPEWELARRCVVETGRNLFLTGRAGTGKTTFLHRLRDEAPKRMVVAAPTGVAAINAGGVTLHSFFQLPLGVLLPGALDGDGDRKFRFSREKRALVQALDLLVIDEISMVRADVLDAVDEILRRLRADDRPFGGVQLLLIGDLRQLPPVAKDDEWAALRGTYDTPYFFGSRALARAPCRCIELRRVYRQRESEFVRLLNEIREGRTSGGALDALNRRCVPAAPGDDTILLCSHNAQAQAINEERLAALPGAPRRYDAAVSGAFPEGSWPADGALSLKVGAQVMFLKNDPDKRFFNGRIGRVVRLADGRAWVRCAGDDADIDVGPMSWDNLKYSTDPESGELRQEVAGTFSQVPLRLAWAITIHKSQGLTFDRVRLLADRSFAPGQVYVALSRCRTLDGLALERPIPPSAVLVDPVVDRRLREIEERAATPETLAADRLEYRAQVLASVFAFRDLARAAYSLRRLAATDPGALAPGVPAALADLYDAVAFDAEGVGRKFLGPLQAALDPWTDPDTLPPALDARLKKAADYYLPLLDGKIIRPAAAIDTSTDNRAVGVALRRDLRRLREAAAAKRAAFEDLRDGFTVPSCLRRVARAIFSSADSSSSSTSPRSRRARADASPAPSAPTSAELAGTESLVAALRAYRTETAKQLHWPAYTIFTQKGLYEIAARLPLDLETLARIPGMGRSRAEKYGPGILPLVQAHVASTGAPGTSSATSSSLF
ncbi:MAG: AAA family ATPase [Kiritimatiellae bacterium]|nr:AAA family ATPase [Kiritimatiellia bacterium]